MVMLTWAEAATEEQKKQAIEELSRLPSLVPTVRAFHLGPDAGINAENFDFALAASFDDLEGYLAYRDSPEHQAIVKEFVTPIMGSRAAVQLEQ